MSIYPQQDILNGTGLGAKYSFPTPMKTKNETWGFNSPSRIYAPDSTALSKVGHAATATKGVDGEEILAATVTKYGSDEDDVISRAPNNGKSLLGSIAKIIAGIDDAEVSTDYTAAGYFTGRVPTTRAARSLLETANTEGKNTGGSGVARDYYYAAWQYPDRILTTSDGGELVPRPPEGYTGLKNLIPDTPTDAAPPKDPNEETNDKAKDEQDKQNTNLNTTADSVGHSAETEQNSVDLVTPEGTGTGHPLEEDFSDSDGGDVISNGSPMGHPQTASTGVRQYSADYVQMMKAMGWM